MAMEFIRKLQVVSAYPGTLQSTGIQPAAITLGDGSPFSVVVNTDMSDPLTVLVGTSVWVRIDDTDPGVSIPAPGVATSESTAPVITATVEQIAPPTAV